MDNQQIWDKLRAPFKADDIEWRIAQKGVNGQGQPWAKVLAYVTNRAIMERLDEVMGPDKWSNSFENIGGAFLCTLSLKCGDEWISKQDGAQESQIEATKGGISGAMKRAGSQWGIGRYLYNLTEGWAVISINGANYSGKQKAGNGKPEIPAFKWDPPQLPDWALPEEESQQPFLTYETAAELIMKEKAYLKDVWTKNYKYFQADLSVDDFAKLEELKDELKGGA